MIGETINERYLIEGELGRGGMGIVYRGRDLLLKRPVAVKVVGSSLLGTEGRARLLREAQAAASLNQANIVAVYDAGEATLPDHEGAAYIVMELVDGPTLQGYRPADTKEALAILAQICAALEAAHQRGIIHRDLKPGNVALASDGLVKLMDFGLARMGGRSLLTQDGTFMGTFDYLAPEIIQGKAAGVASDLYALGVLAYELLTGQRPFEADTPAAILSQHLHAPVRPPSAYNPDIPPTLEYLVVRLLNKQPENRPGSAAEVRQALLEAAESQAAIADPQFPIPGPRLDFLVRGRLVGREQELAEGLAVWRKATAGRRQVLLISGEPGIGKTRLATELAAQAQFGGALLLEGQCYENGGLPYMPLAQMIRTVYEGEKEPPRLQTAVLADLKRLAPDLDLAEPAANHSSQGDRDADENRLFESIVTLCQVLARQQPLLLSFDDLHWADSGTIGVLRHLARRLPDAPLLILATYREIDLTGRRPVRKLLDDLRREAGAVRLKLLRLDKQQTETLLSTIFTETIRGDFLDAIYRETEGNPFFVEEICKALVESGELRREAGRWLRPEMDQIQLPQSIQVTIETRLEQLDQETLSLLRVAAMLGRDFRYDMLQVASGMAEETLVNSLEDALRGQLIQEPAGRPAAGLAGPSFSFTHALIQATLLNGLGLLRRQLLARRLAVALEEAFPEDLPAMATRLGQLYSLAGDGSRAAPYLRQAAGAARQLFAYDEALELFEQALHYLRQGDDIDATARTLLAIGATSMKAGRFERARRAFDEAFGLWRQAPLAQSRPEQRLPVAKRPFRSHTPDPVTLDPTRSTDSSSGYIMRQVFQGLVEVGSGDELLPAAAESWEILDGGRRYIFHLREDALWSDGQPVVAADFEFAWKRLLDPLHGKRLAPAFFDVRGARNYFEGATGETAEIGVKALDRYTLQVELERPVAYFLHLAAAEYAFPVPKHVVERLGDEWPEIAPMVCNGAFQVVKWERDQQLILERNPLYDGPYGGNVGRVELSLVNDGALLEAYAAGQIECLYITLLSAQDLGQALRRFGADLISLPSMATAYLAFNCARPPFDDQRVRQALAMAMDVEELADGLLHGLHEPATGGLIPPGVAGHGLGPKTRYDPESARRLLAEAGYPQGQGMPPLTCYEFARAGAGFSTGSWICDQLRETLGLDVDLKQVTMAQMVQYQESEERLLWHLGWSVDYSDPDAFMRAGDWPAACNWPNERFIEVVEAARYETNQGRRLALYEEAEMIMGQEAPLIPLMYARWQLLVQPWVQRLATSPTVWTIFRDVLIEDG